MFHFTWGIGIKMAAYQDYVIPYLTIKQSYNPHVWNGGQLGRQPSGLLVGHTSCMGLLPVAHPESCITGGQLVVPAVATHMGTFLGAHRMAQTAV